MADIDEQEILGRIRRYYEKIENCKMKIKRLEKTRDSVKNLKSGFKSKQKAEKKLKEQSGDWKGNTKDSFNGYIDDLDYQSQTYYDNTLDFIHDEINRAIRDLNNEITENWGIIGSLARSINYVGTEIVNFFN